MLLSMKVVDPSLSPVQKMISYCNLNIIFRINNSYLEYLRSCILCKINAHFN